MCAELYGKDLDHENELVHLQQTIKVHTTNSDLWLRIAECYGHLCNLDVYSVPFNMSKTKDATWFAAASLLRVEILLKSVAGREADSVGVLKRKRNQKLRNLVQPAIASLPTNFVTVAQEVCQCIYISIIGNINVHHFGWLQALSRDVYNLDPQIQDDEFVDLGSSKQTKTLECNDENSDNATLGNGSQLQDEFEKHWFHFADSIQDINLYCISPENTHGCDA